MEDNKSKKSKKRHHSTPDLPSKQHLMESPTGEKPQPQQPQKRAVPHTTTAELLKYLGLFLCQRCHNLKDLSYKDPISWIKYIDEFLIDEGHQSKSFLSSGSLVFLYMLCRDLISSELDNVIELQASLFTCLYIAYCYIGIEVSYPARPFIVRTSEMGFWARCLSFIRKMSSKMICINENRQIYSVMLAELKAIGRSVTLKN